MPMRWDVLALVAAALIGLIWLYRRDRDRARRLRGGFFTACAQLARFHDQRRMVRTAEEKIVRDGPPRPAAASDA